MKSAFFRNTALFIMCVAVGILLVAQARVTNGQRLYVSPKIVTEYEASIKGEKDAIAKIKEQTSEAEKLLEKYILQQEEEQAEIVEEKLRAELNGYQLMAGGSTVQGPGVRIVVDDGTRALFQGENINNLLVHDVDILAIINELKKCRAEAIAVNGNRITPTTSITCSGYTVRMDGRTYARPFEITAIGDPKRISNILLAPDGYGTSLKNWGVQFYLEVYDKMVITASPKEVKFRFAKPIQIEKQGS